mmetsp:Transcript_33382/g.32838  ORF Transcript_33382/g.32838 Transcript_33382/m.32838 type:complete len:94 (+) Transcript_33382:609-890(+)
MASPYIIANRLKNVSEGDLNLSDLQNKHIPKKLNPMNIGVTPTKILNIIGKAVLIVLGALYNLVSVSINLRMPIQAPKHPKPIRSSLKDSVIE